MKNKKTKKDHEDCMMAVVIAKPKKNKKKLSKLEKKLEKEPM